MSIKNRATKNFGRVPQDFFICIIIILQPRNLERGTLEKFTYKNDSLVSFHPTGNCGDGVTGNDCFEKNLGLKSL